MFEFLLMAGGLGLFFYVQQQSTKIGQLSKDVRALKRQIEALQQPGNPDTQIASQNQLAMSETSEAATETTPTVTAEAANEDVVSIVVSEAPQLKQSASESAPDPIETKIETASPAATLHLAASVPAAKPKAEVKPKESLESKLGARWTVWVGGLALAFGGLFMVKYSIENGLISPGLRLTLAALFGLGLIAAGEAVRRRIGAFASATYENALIPGVLTAAGSLTLMGSIFAAHMFYGYLGSGTAFTLLALVSLATVALSLMHGQALAGLGLLAAFVTPLAVRTTEPNPWGLFLFLIIAWVSTTGAARLREWKFVAMMANLGLSFWSIIYVLDLNDGVWPVTVATLVMILGTAFIWPGNRADADIPLPPPRRLSAQQKSGNGTAPGAGSDEDASNKVSPQLVPLSALFFGPFMPNFVTMSIGSLLIGLTLLAAGTTGIGLRDNPVPAFAILVAALGFIGIFRMQAIMAAAAAAGLAVLGYFVLSAPLFQSGPVVENIVEAVVNADTALYTCLILSLIFVGLGLAKALLLPNPHRRASGFIAGLAVGVPLTVLALGYFAIGNFTRDWLFGGVTLLVGLVYLSLAEALHRRSVGPDQTTKDRVIAIYVAGSALAFMFAIHAVANGITTTLLIAALGFAYVMGTRFRPWSILPWIMGLANVVVMARIGWNPSIVSADALSKTPFFNALLPGYGIPALLTAIAAYDLRNWPNAAIRNFLQALASLGVLLTVAILIRHAMNGGVLDSTTPTLAEQSIYTLLAIGASAVMMTLDLRAPSPVFRWGSMTVGVLSILSIAIAHLITLNPVQTGEHTGNWPILDLLLIGYLLPALAALGLAFYADGKRPFWYRNLIENTGYVLLFVWVPLELRHLFHGSILTSGVRIDTTEVFLWPLCWLAISFAFLYLGQFLAKKVPDPNLESGLFPSFVGSLERASFGFAGVAVISLAVANLFIRNPYFSGESTGSSSLFNLLLLGYCIPAIVLLVRALVGRRQDENRIAVLSLSVSGLILLLTYVTLFVRRFWQGEFIPGWNGFQQGETYTYSVVWLIFGIILLVLGSRLNAISLRLASAAIVFLTVVKVFLIDMSNLEGILRALSFIGLGLVLIAIGMFYQRVLGNLSKPKSGGETSTDSDKGEAVSTNPSGS